MALVLADPLWIVGRRIEAARRAAGMSQERLATAAGVSRAKLSRIECGDPSIRVGDLQAIASALARAGSPAGALL